MVLVLGSPAALRALAQGAAVAAGGPAAEEMKYVDGLNRLGLPNYAELVLARLGSGPEVKARQLDAALARGEFDKVKATIDAELDQNSLAAWMMRLRLADAYFAWGKYPECRALYDGLFAKFAGNIPEDFKEFYYNSAYGYAQMLVLMNDPAAAIEAYRAGLKANPPRDTQRQFLGGLGDLLMRRAEKTTGAEQQKYITEADEIAGQLLWIQDLWFGQAIILKAHAKMLQGDVDAAMKLVDDYRDELVGLDQILAEQSTEDEDFTRLSPMAQARYLLGAILLDEAKKILAAGGDRKRAEELLVGKQEQRTGKPPRQLPGAVQHFGNVYINYPNTQWAAEAGEKFDETKQLLADKFGRTVKTTLTPEQQRKVEAEQIKAAKSLLNQQKYAEAAEQYQGMLRRAPEGDYALMALTDLGTCYVELKDDLYADVVIRYIAERFNKNPKFSAGTRTRAGDVVLGFGSMYNARKMPERKDAIYETFFDNFKTHALAAQLLNSFGDRRLATNDYAGALRYYQRVARDHTNSPSSFVAMSKMAQCYEKLGDATNALRTLEFYATRAGQENRLNSELIRILYRVATTHREMGISHFPAAVARYNEIDKRLTEKREAYQTGAEEAKQNQDIQEAALYFKAACFARVTPPKDKPENTYKEMALGFYLKLADAYPKSKLAPTALSQAGTLWTVLGKAEEAQAVFSRLKTQYPEAKEAKNVDFILANNLLKLGRRKEAIPLFKQMFSSGAQYTPGQMLAAGRELFQAKEYEIAVEAFDQVLAKAPPEERTLIEPTLALKGRSLVALGRYAEGVTALDALFAQFSKTPYTVECQVALSKACAELGGVEADATARVNLFNKSVTAMKTVMQHDTNTVRRGEATVQVGSIYELKAKAEAAHGTPERAAEFRDQAIASYQILTLFEDPRDLVMRPYLDEGYHRCLALYLEAARWKDLSADAGAYLAAFPDGKYVLDIRQWRSTANAHLAAEGGAPEAAAPAEPSAEVAPPNS